MGRSEGNEYTILSPHVGKEATLRRIREKLLTIPLALLAVVAALRADGQAPPAAEQSTFQPLPLQEAEVVPRPLPKPESPLELAELEQLALSSNPSLAQAEARVAAAQGRWVQVGLPPNPTFGYSAAEIGDEGKAGQQGFVAGQEFVTANKLELRRQVAARDIEQAQQEALAQEFRVRADVRQRFYETLIAQQRVIVAQSLFDTASRSASTIEKLLQAEQSTRIDLLQAQVEAESVSVRVQNARNSHDAAWRRLVAVVGIDLPQRPLAGEFTFDLPLADWEESLARVQIESPEVAAANVGIQRARWALQRACAEARPNVEVQFGVQYDDATQDPISMLQIVTPLTIFNRNQGGIREAQAQITEASRNAERLQRELAQRLAGVFERYANAHQQVQTYSEKILPRAKETLELVTTGYRAGEVQYLTLLTAQRTYFETNLAYLTSLEQLWAAHVEIESLLLTGSLNAPKSDP